MSSSVSRNILNKQGRKFDEVWSFYKKTPLSSQGHYMAECVFCKHAWSRAYVYELQSHLANVCLSCPDDVKNFYIGFLSADGDNTAEEPKPSNLRKRNYIENDQRDIHYYFENKNLPDKKVDSINKALIRAFVCSGVPFNVINNPFFKEFLYELRPNYNPPSRQTLSNQLLSKEIAKVNNSINIKLDSAENLTIGKYM